MKKLLFALSLFISTLAFGQNGSVPVAGPIGTIGPNDKYPTHLSNLQKGGWDAVADIAARNAIPPQRRTVGMVRYVISDGNNYRLVGDTTVASWTLVPSGGSTIIDTAYKGSVPSQNRTISTLLNQPYQLPQVMPASIAPTVVALTTTNPITSPVGISRDDSRIKVTRGLVVQLGPSFPDNGFNKPAYVTSANSGPQIALSIGVNGNQFGFYLKGTGSKYRIWVNGQLIQEAPFTTPVNGSLYYQVITFATTEYRNITIEGANGFAYGAFYTNTGGSFVDPGYYYARSGIAFGDSFTEGTGAQAQFMGFSDLMGQMLTGSAGNFVSSGSGGTGWNTAGGTAGRYRFIDRLAADLGPFSPSAIFWFGGINDTLTITSPSSRAAFRAVVLATVDSAAAMKPGVPQIICGPWRNTGNNVPRLDTISSILKSVALQRGYLFIDNKGWITGNGRVGAPNGSGNSDYYISSDGTHPSTAGHLYLAKRVIADYIYLTTPTQIQRPKPEILGIDNKLLPAFMPTGFSYNFGTGLTNTAGTVTNNLSTGISGNQVLIGSTGVNGKLAIQGNNNAGSTGSNVSVDFAGNTGTVLGNYTNNGIFKWGSGNGFTIGATGNITAIGGSANSTISPGVFASGASAYRINSVSGTLTMVLNSANSLTANTSGIQFHLNTQLGSAGNPVIKFSDVSPVNQVTIGNAAAFAPPTISATGTDANINLSLTGKGTGGVRLNALVIPTITAGSTSDSVLTRDPLSGLIKAVPYPTGGGSGTVTSVSSANTDIGVATGTTTPVLTLNSGSGANQIAKRDGSGNFNATTVTNGVYTTTFNGLGDARYPLLNGSGANGTWGINVTGNAATVTNGVYTSTLNSLGDARWGQLSANNAWTGENYLNNKTFGVYGASTAPDAIGGIGVTMPADGNTYGMIGLTRYTATAITMGMNTSNDYVLGSSLGRGVGAIMNRISYRHNITSGSATYYDSSNNPIFDISVLGAATANSFVKSGGTSSQFLKADGSVDGNTYLTAGSAATYSEGSWSPTVDDASGGFQGQYMKIGNMVVAHFEISITSAIGTGVFAIYGLPFTLNSSARGTASISATNLGTPITGRTDVGGTDLFLYDFSGVKINTPAMVGKYVTGTITYRAQ